MKRLMTEAKLGERLYAYNFPLLLLAALPARISERMRCAHVVLTCSKTEV